MDITTEPLYINDSDRRAIAEILKRRANDVATFKDDLDKKTEHKFDGLPGSVEMALSREVKRLRRLAALVEPAPKPSEDDDD